MVASAMALGRSLTAKGPQAATLMINDQVDAVLKEIAEALKAGSIAFVDKHDWWVILFEEELPLFMAPSGRSNHWVLSGPIADLPEVAAEKFSNLAMIYNGQPELSGGFRIGLDEPDGMLKLSLDLSPADLERDTLLAIITEFRKCRQTWERLAENWQPAASGGPQSAQTIRPDLRA